MSKSNIKHKASRRHYSEDFKREAVFTYEERGKSYAEICRLLDISHGSVLKDWCVLYGPNKKALKRTVPMASDDHSSPLSHGPETAKDEERISALETEVNQLKQALVNQAAKDYLSSLREEIWERYALKKWIN